MKRIIFVLTATVIIGLLAAGCASSSKPAPTTAARDLTGNWSGRAGTPGGEAPVTLRLSQSGTAVDGEMYVGGRGDLSGPVNGTVDGNTVRLTLGSSFGQSSSLQIAPGGNQITGNMVGSRVLLTRSR